jgi:hypothetical protein
MASRRGESIFMASVARGLIKIGLAGAVLLASAAMAEAAGALAVGACEGMGYVINFINQQEAGVAAMTICSQTGDKTCAVRLTIQGSCFALALDPAHPCGARGWAYADSADEANSLAVAACVKNNGDNCTPKISVCDR